MATSEHQDPSVALVRTGPLWDCTNGPWEASLVPQDKLPNLMNRGSDKTGEGSPTPGHFADFDMVGALLFLSFGLLSEL